MGKVTQCGRELEGAGGGGLLNKVYYGGAPPRGPTPYPFLYHV